MKAAKDPLPLKVTLYDGPGYPLETLWCVWEQSRHDRPLPTPEELRGVLKGIRNNETSLLRGYGFKTLGEFSNYFRDTVEKLLGEDIPVTENLAFVFLIENMPISLREQLVRHRIGNHIGPRMGADLVPDLAESAWWSQTMRVLDMGTFYDDGHYIIPPSVLDKHAITPYGSESCEKVYRDCLKKIQETYKALVAAGVPKEDARQIIPLGTTHRMTWHINLKSMMHIFGKRSCWIAQYGLWGELLTQMVEALCDEYGEFFREIVNPPCIKKGAWQSCPFQMINLERVSGSDGFPPCPLWLHHQRDAALSEEARHQTTAWMHHDGRSSQFPGGWVTLDSLQHKQMVQGREEYARLWGRDVDTGERLES